ncbi:L-lactate permease [Candidatus Saccharibacteria bacterium]|nr:L-lactate permease [Candidatus Saccharibacteria bacterium]
MSFVLALFPILLSILLLVWLKLSSRLTLFFAWLSAVLIAMFFWNMNVLELSAWTVLGGLKAIDIILIISGAILLLNVLKHSGGMRAIEKSLMAISVDARVQALLIGWFFVSFMEGAAGFGVPAALAAPLLVSAGFAPLAAVAFALICNGTATAFGAAGTPMLTELSIVAGQVDGGAVVALTAGIHAVVGLIVPLVGMFVLLKMQKIDNFKRRFIEIIPFTLVAAAAFVVPYLTLALIFGVELPSIVGAVVGLLVVVLITKKGWLVPKRHLTLELQAEIKTKNIHPKKMGTLRAWLPYLMIVVILVLTRLPFWDLGSWLKGVGFAWTDILGVAGAGHTIAPLWSPGVWFIVVAVITIFLHGVRSRGVGEILKNTGKQVWGAAVALVFGVALTQVMINSGGEETLSMVGAIAMGLSQALGPVYLAISPVLGILGAFVSGSNTVANMLFTPSQFASATALGLPTTLILALQCVGGSFGNIVAINNVVAASATVGLTGQEGRVIKTNFIPLLIFTVLIVVVSLVIYQFLR